MAHLRNVLSPAFAPAALASLALSGFVATYGCEAYHNEPDRLQYKKALADQEAKLFPEGTAGTSAGKGPGYDPPDPTQCPNNNRCTPDPGSRVLTAQECGIAEWGLEFAPMPILDFEDERTGFDDKNKNHVMEDDEGPVPDERFALLSYTYRDDTTLNYFPFGWEPRAISDPWGRCERPDNHVFHIAGGPFLEWGGAFGRSLRCMNTNVWTTNPTQIKLDAWRLEHGFSAADNTMGQIYCHYGNKGGTALVPSACMADPTKQPAMASLCPQRELAYKAWNANKEPNKAPFPANELPLIGVAVDASKWEGISFWGRRSANSQAGIRVLLGDQYTDDDISFASYLLDPMVPRNCERALECKCKSSSRPCTKLTKEDAQEIGWALNSYHEDVLTPCNSRATPEEREACWSERNSYVLLPPQEGDKMCWDRNGPDAYAVAARTLQYCDESYLRHQTDSAKSLNAHYDPIVWDTKCQEFSFRGSITSDFPYNPASPIPGQQQPPETSETCGDHWMKSIDLDYDWKFYKVPFTDFLQQGWAKRSYKLDLTALTLLRFAWDRGYVDVYIDDVRFYRQKDMSKATN